MYKIVVKRRTDELEEEVNNLIDNGWYTDGGVAVTPEGYYVQAVLRHPGIVEIPTEDKQTDNKKPRKKREVNLQG